MRHLNKTISNKTLLVVLGPTAVGKTTTAIQLAQHFQTEIISCDSRQFYQQLKIGTATPTQKELNQVPHHFIGHLNITDEYNVSRFEQDTLELLDRLFKKNDLVIMTGGSGMYIDAVCQGIDEFPDIDIKLREEIMTLYQDNGLEAIQNKLEELDPEYYDIVDKKNPKRLIRAIEVCIASGKKYSELRKSKKAERQFKIIKIGLNTQRSKLFERINIRTEMMMKQGLLDEAKELYTSRGLNALNTVGYKELFKFLDGKISLEQAIEDIKTNTRRYAKRQLTWFKRDKDIEWFEPQQIEQIKLHIAQNLIDS